MLDDIDRMLVARLNSSSYLGGAKLGQRWGISRVAVSKRFRRLRNLGVPVHALPGKGYFLAQGGNLLCEQAIRAYLREDENKLLEQLEVHAEIESTNIRAAQLGCRPGMCSLVLAESQVGGQGRRSRQWVSTPWRNLAATLVWRLPRWPADLPSMSLLAGLVVAQALELAGVTDVQIKWPNDIFLGGKKLGGILVSARGDASGDCELLIGMGINHDLSGLDVDKIDQPWVDLRSRGYPVDRNQLAALLLQGFMQHLPLFEQRGFKPFRDEWNRRALYRGQRVHLVKPSPGEPVNQMPAATLARLPRYLCIGADIDGSLMLQGEGELLRLTDADYSLRPVA